MIERFCKRVLEKFSKDDLLTLLNKMAYFQNKSKIVKGTYFCNSSLKMLLICLQNYNSCKKIFKYNSFDVDFENIYKIKTDSKIIEKKKLVVASGGLSYSMLGASSIGFDIAKKKVWTYNKKLEPALVGFTVQKEQFWFKNLAGISTLFILL